MSGADSDPAPGSGPAVNRKVMVIGLDCAEPSLVFDRWWNDLPNLRKIGEAGSFGRMRSCDPPITVPAWSVMTSGLDPGELGCYGFRNRVDYSYKEMEIADARAIKIKRIWDYFSDAGKDVILLGVPQTYPIRPIKGCVVGDFLAGDTSVDYCYPPGLKEEVERVADGYVLDVTGFRTLPKEEILRRIIDMTVKRFRVARHLLATKPWDFFMMVEIGLDRLHHAFWSHVDPEHPKHDPNHPLNGCVKEYYQLLDREIGALVDQFGPEATGNDTDIYVVSDHGAQRMEGGFCINDWLIQEGYLVLKGPRVPSESISGPRPFDHSCVDWPRTKVWAEGGYYARLFLNIQGREPEGIVPPDEVEALRDELIEKLEALRLPTGVNFDVQVAKPEHLYKLCGGIPPDLMAYFGNLRWRALATTSHPSLFSLKIDSGADEANHGPEGIFLTTEKNFAKTDGYLTIQEFCGRVYGDGNNSLQLPALGTSLFPQVPSERATVSVRSLKELGYF